MREGGDGRGEEGKGRIKKGMEVSERERGEVKGVFYARAHTFSFSKRAMYGCVTVQINK